MAKRPAKIAPAAAAPPLPRYADFAEFGRETIAAAMDSQAALSAGLEAIGQEMALYTRATFESAGETARALLGARTLEEIVRLQTDFARRSFEGFVERSTKLSALGCTLLGASGGARGERAKA